MHPVMVNDPTIRRPEDRPNENRSKLNKPVKLKRIIKRLRPIKVFPKSIRFLIIINDKYKLINIYCNCFIGSRQGAHLKVKLGIEVNTVWNHQCICKGVYQSSILGSASSYFNHTHQSRLKLNYEPKKFAID